MRRNWSYWLAVAIALFGLVYVLWVQVTAGPEPNYKKATEDAEKREQRQSSLGPIGPLETTLYREIRPDLSGDLEEKAIMAAGLLAAKAEMARDVGYSEATGDHHGSIHRKITNDGRVAGWSRLRNWGCPGGVSRDCNLLAFDNLGGVGSRAIWILAVAYDKQSGNYLRVQDHLNPASIDGTFKTWERNGEWHDTFGCRSEPKLTCFAAKGRSYHDETSRRPESKVFVETEGA